MVIEQTPQAPQAADREYTDGAAAIVRGAIAAGCTFFAGYPITPASGILMTMTRELPKVGGVSIQGEDELASIGMCIGAAMSGARAMTATSGPGISLYSENIGFAIMGEVPLVIVDVQRMGPSTGAATTVAQGDVQFVRWGTAGGYPIIALSPTNVVECYSLTVRAFELAERFRCPVFLLTDKEVVMTLATVDVSRYPEVSPVPRPLTAGVAPYRFEPAAEVPVMQEFGRGSTLRFTGSTHDESAYITKDPDTVGALNRHLIAKIEEHRDEIEMVDADLQPGADTLVVAYGVTAGAMKRALRLARAVGTAVSGLVVHSIWPIPETALGEAVAGIERIIVPELNPGLYRREIERVAGDREIVGIERIDGELITAEQIVEVIG